MALYNEISADILNNILAADEENRKRKQLEAYNNQKAQLDKTYNTNNGGLGGFLGSLVGGIGKGIGDVAKGTFGVIGGGAAGIKDLLEGKAGTQENQNAFKRWLYDAETDKDAAAKAAGTALNAATTLGTAVVPGIAGAGSAAAKLGTSALGNTAAGAIGGIADEFQQQGANANMESAANRAISGAVAGLATGGLNKKIGNATGNISSKLLNNKLATSTLGRGALSGAVGGATGAGTSAALGGGDITSAALQGAASGALSGATQAGLMSGANRLGQSMRNRIGGNRQTNNIVATDTAVENTPVSPEEARRAAQFELIQEKNPMLDDYHTGIRSVDEIKTFRDNVAAYNDNSEDFVYPDWTIDKARTAAKNGKVTIYSSKPIEEGAFVSPSKMMAQDYAGGGQVYSKEIPLDDVAWINGDEGNYAPIRLEAPKKQNTDLDIPDYTKPTDYQGNEIKITKKNIGQKLGDSLALTGERIENADLYNSLYSKTASDIVKNDTVNKLRKLGYTPENYKEAAKISTTTNKFVDDIVKNSGATIVDNGLVDRIAQPSIDNAINTPAYQKVYESTVKGVLDKIEKGSIPGKYNASDLLSASRDVNKIANKYLKKATNVNGGDLATDAGALADALFDVKRELRNLATTSVDGFGDNYTKTQLSQRLKNLGATDAAIADMMEAKNIGEFISKTAKYEDARQMAYEMDSNLYRRNAISGSKTNTNVMNRLTQDSGAGELLSVATKPVGKLVGKGARLAGNAISGISSAVAMPTDGTVQPMSQNTLNLLGNFIGRTEGVTQADNAVQNARKTQDYQNLEDMFSTSMANIEAEYAPLRAAMQAQQVSPAQAQLADIANGMSLALAAGDIDSYNKLASLYQTAYKMYELQNPTTTSNKEVKLSKTQQQANAAALALDELENMNPDFGYRVKDIPGLNLVNATGNKYSSTADSLAMQIGYMLSGANIKEDEAKKIGSAYVPQPFDDEATRKYKLQQARNIIQQYQNTYVTDANNA